MTSTLSRDPSRPGEWSYATRPTRRTIFLRTFVPWQIWRFVRINMRMFRAIAKSHH